jgi:hypothetical protein
LFIISWCSSGRVCAIDRPIVFLQSCPCDPILLLFLASRPGLYRAFDSLSSGASSAIDHLRIAYGCASAIRLGHCSLVQDALDLVAIFGLKTGHLSLIS